MKGKTDYRNNRKNRHFSENIDQKHQVSNSKIETPEFFKWGFNKIFSGERYIPHPRSPVVVAIHVHCHSRRGGKK